MEYYTLVAAVAFEMHQKVHLLLDDIAVVTAEGDDRGVGAGPAGRGRGTNVGSKTYESH